jgi:hypothetical protein
VPPANRDLDAETTDIPYAHKLKTARNIKPNTVVVKTAYK